MGNKKITKPTDLFGAEIHLHERALTIGPKHIWMLAHLEEFTLEKLKKIYFSLTGIKISKPQNKAGYCTLIAYILSFDTQNQFDEFFSTLLQLVQEAVRLTVFTDYLLTAPLEKQYGVTLRVKNQHSYYYGEVEFEPAVRMDLFTLVDTQFIELPALFRKVFSSWLPKPKNFFLNPCEASLEASLEAPLEATWSNVTELADSLPLLLEASLPFIKKNDRYMTVKKGLIKSDLKKLRALSGQKEFPLGTPSGVDPINLALRVILCLFATIPKRPADIDTWVRTLIRRFLLDESVYIGQSKSLDYLSGGLLEHLALTDHLGVNHPHQIPDSFIAPQSRLQLKTFLSGMAKSGQWYEVENMRASLEAQGIPFMFSSLSYESWNLKLKGEVLDLGNYVFKSHYGEEFSVYGPLRDQLLRMPLLRAYFYMLSVFGVVEIIEKEGAVPLTRNGKRISISPYDALTHARVTAYGRWCLGLSETKPKRTVEEFEAIADSELLLVTFRGKSLERRLFLEQIGEKMGDERFRVSEASFIRDCSTKAEIESLIQRFKKLIDAEPSPRWEELFATIRSRAGLFSRPTECYVFTLPADPRIRQIFTEDVRLRTLVIRAEGSRIVIDRDDYKRLVKILTEYGFSTPLG